MNGENRFTKKAMGREYTTMDRWVQREAACIAMYESHAMAGMRRRGFEEGSVNALPAWHVLEAKERNAWRERFDQILFREGPI